LAATTVVSAPHPVGPQDLVVGRGGQQRLIQGHDRLFTQTAGELDQGGGVWHLPAQGDAAKPLPGDRIGHLTTQRLIAQPVPELQKHHPQVGLHRDRRPADPSIEMPSERREEPRIVQQRIHPTQLDRQHQQLDRQNRIPQRRLLVYSSEHDGLNPF
jgi:hypothetical protein